MSGIIDQQKEIYTFFLPFRVVAPFLPYSRRAYDENLMRKCPGNYRTSEFKRLR